MAALESKKKGPRAPGLKETNENSSSRWARRNIAGAKKKKKPDRVEKRAREARNKTNNKRCRRRCERSSSVRKPHRILYRADPLPEARTQKYPRAVPAHLTSHASFSRARFSASPMSELIWAAESSFEIRARDAKSRLQKRAAVVSQHVARS